MNKRTQFAIAAVILVASGMVAIASLPTLDVRALGEGLRTVALPLLGIYALIGWTTFFGKWAIKAYGAWLGAVLTLAPIIALFMAVLAFVGR